MVPLRHLQLHGNAASQELSVDNTYDSRNSDPQEPLVLGGSDEMRSADT